MSSVKNVEKKEEDTKKTNSNQNLDVKETVINIAGRDIIIQTGKLAKQANGSVTIRCGDTTLLVTAVKSDEPRKDIDFFPLLCDFEERFTSIGRIPGSFN